MSSQIVGRNTALVTSFTIPFATAQAAACIAAEAGAIPALDSTLEGETRNAECGDSGS